MTRHFSIKNHFALSMLEGFNKWAKAGIKAFASHELRHFALPDSAKHETSYNEQSISIGGQLVKTQGHTLHYNVIGETYLIGEDAGQLKLDANVDVNIPFWGDTVRIEGKGYFHKLHQLSTSATSIRSTSGGTIPTWRKRQGPGLKA